jgi:hypothetical protein
MSTNHAFPGGNTLRLAARSMAVNITTGIAAKTVYSCLATSSRQANTHHDGVTAMPVGRMLRGLIAPYGPLC